MGRALLSASDVIVQRSSPLNAEVSLDELSGRLLTPTASFYVRNHFEAPKLEPAAWRLEIGGMVDNPLRLDLAQIQRMPSQTMVVTLECAGNGRSLLTPPVDGEPWGLGAVSTAEWTGTPLVDVLHRAGVSSQARDLVFRGADAGHVNGRSGLTAFERSLTVEQAASSGALLAYAMNGAPLPVDHGYPLRLVVPGWYGVASVKWLTAIEAVDTSFDGFFQVDRYYYEWPRNDGLAREPVTLQRVRTLITEPRPGATVHLGEVAVRGLAWSGSAPIARVEMSTDGDRWNDVQLLGEGTAQHWRLWESTTTIRRPGLITLRARATDRTGRTQPNKPEWNRLGYGANPVHEVRVQAT